MTARAESVRIEIMERGAITPEMNKAAERCKDVATRDLLHLSRSVLDDAGRTGLLTCAIVCGLVDPSLSQRLEPSVERSLARPTQYWECWRRVRVDSCGAVVEFQSFPDISLRDKVEERDGTGANRRKRCASQLYGMAKVKSKQELISYWNVLPNRRNRRATDRFRSARNWFWILVAKERQSQQLFAAPCWYLAGGNVNVRLRRATCVFFSNAFTTDHTLVSCSSASFARLCSRCRSMRFARLVSARSS